MTDGGLEATGPHVLETGVLRLGPSEARADIGSPPSPEPALPVVEADIFFLFDSADFAPGESAKLDRFAVALEDPAAAAVTFLVLGHTDAKGSAAYNCALSARRADALAAALAERGVAAGRLVAIGVGEALPRNAADPTAAENRRVAFAPLKAADADRIVRLARLCP
ncbi:OmpA family protein [Acuticoccus sp. 2012]|uniref:OmpA family protein n=2 Tax=Acuticoccus mangrovi TaxID=2796142 RepID=A0A934IPR3_9HYPH|nr:OmpA family protein [Acuticoccus mangrovi]MBJ3776062.1 OmpA family protein [Acuticoccus mangrovi]